MPLLAEGTPRERRVRGFVVGFVTAAVLFLLFSLGMWAIGALYLATLKCVCAS